VCSSFEVLVLLSRGSCLFSVNSRLKARWFLSAVLVFGSFLSCPSGVRAFGRMGGCLVGFSRCSCSYLGGEAKLCVRFLLACIVSPHIWRWFLFVWFVVYMRDQLCIPFLLPRLMLLAFYPTRTNFHFKKKNKIGLMLKYVKYISTFRSD